MLAPALAAAAMLVLLPVLDTLWLSLHDVVLFRPRSRPFVGLANYARALSDPVFWESLWQFAGLGGRAPCRCSSRSASPPLCC